MEWHGAPRNGRESMGSWGYNPPYRGYMAPVRTGWGPPLYVRKSYTAIHGFYGLFIWAIPAILSKNTMYKAAIVWSKIHKKKLNHQDHLIPTRILDGWNPATVTSWGWGVHPITSRVFNIQTVVVWDFWTINSTSKHLQLNSIDSMANLMIFFRWFTLGTA